MRRSERGRLPMPETEQRRMRTKRLKRLMYRPASGVRRECGGCTACCMVMAVREFGKGMYRSCEHVDGQGCSIYQERPRSCRVWSCQWQLAAIDGERPDRSGVLVNLSFRGGPHYEVFELWQDAAAQPAIVETLKKLRYPVYVFGYESKGRSGAGLHGTHTNNCPLGHGEPSSRMSLTVLRE